MVYLGWNSEPKVVEEKFSMPAYFRAQLPMGYYIVKLVSPKRYLARHLNNEYGFRMTTYENREFARVRLNSLGFVEEIVVVTDKVLYMHIHICENPAMLRCVLILCFSVSRFRFFKVFLRST